MSNLNRQHEVMMLFKNEIQTRLERMREESPPYAIWPEGCYGSLAGLLAFVGPSPGGGSKVSEERDRVMDGGTPLWNQDFTDPFISWSNGFKTSMRPLVETILGIPFEMGASKLFTVLNFHWQQNPDAAYVPANGMEDGSLVVLSILEKIQPIVVVTMESRSHELLSRALRDEKYKLNEPENVSIAININDKGYTHRYMKGYRITGTGVLSGLIVVKSPQHPARIYNLSYAYRCAKAIRSLTEQIYEGKDKIIVNELAH